VISVFKNHKIIIKNYFKVPPQGFYIILRFCIQKTPVSLHDTLHDTKTKFVGHIDNALLNIAIYNFCAESPLPW
jgi:hypothetical protein